MKRTAWILFAGLLGCGSLQELPPLDGTIAIGGYRISAPEGPGWSVRLDAERGEALFISPKDPPWHGAGFTLIRVAPGEPLPASKEAAPDDVARELFAREEARLESRDGRHRVTDVDRSVVSIGGKTLHRLSYRVLREPLAPEGEPWLARVERYFYFPPDYARTRAHYAFLIADLHVVGVFGERGSLGSIRRVIESFAPAEEPEPPPVPTRPEARP